MTTVKSGAPASYIPDIGIKVVKEKPPGSARRFIDLSLNESSYGASPKAVEAARERCLSPHRYPDPQSTDLRQAIARRYGLDPDQVTCGNGSEELLDVLGRVYARPGDEIVYGRYAFMQFPIVAMRVGATPVTVPETEFQVSAQAYLDAVTDRTRILFLANPNNPSGTYMPAGEVRKLRDGLPGRIVLVIDSAYAEFAFEEDYTDGMELVEGTENVIVTRTFSKAFGLAAHRVGWSYASRDMTSVMNRMRGIGNVNAIAQEAAVAALEDMDFVRHVCEQSRIGRERLAGELTAMGLAPVPSNTNFVLAGFPTDTNHRAGAALIHMAERGIVLRGVEDYGLEDYVRITVGLPDEVDAVIEALKAFMV